MTWFMAGATTLSVATTLYSANQAAASGARAAGSASRAEGEAIVKERLNKTIANSYSTAFAQMQLSLKKKQMSQQSADISAASLMARSTADLGIGSTNSIGASTDAVISDIEQKTNQAQLQTAASFENAVENYNNDLTMMALNTDQSSPNIRQVEYNGPSASEMFGTAILGGLGTFASSYAMKRMQLGPGTTNVPGQIKQG